MPELQNIQAYVTLGNRSPEQALDMFRGHLGDLHLLTGEAQAWVEGVHWSVAEGGLISPSLQPWIHTVIEGAPLEVAPHALAWTPRSVPSLQADWLEIGLLLKTESLLSQPNYGSRYRSEVVRALYHLVRSFISISIDAPTFLTNEAQDGKPWEAWVGAGDEPWAFDLAVAIDRMAWPQQPRPSAFSQTELSGARAVARSGMWPVLPWEA